MVARRFNASAEAKKGRSRSRVACSRRAVQSCSCHSAGAAGAAVGGGQGGDTAVRGQPGLDAASGELIGDGGEIARGVVDVLAETGLLGRSDGHMRCLSGDGNGGDARALLSIMENFEDEGGTIAAPEVLCWYGAPATLGAPR